MIMERLEIHDVVMVGAGPSALAAAIYTTREDVETVLYEKGAVGGLPAITDKVDNYPGFPDGIEGMKLADQLQKQAERFGARIEYGDVSAIQRREEYIELTVDGEAVKARSVLIATGSDYNKLGIPGEAEYYGRGVHYCATCDGAFYREKTLAVVGGGNSAVQEALFLLKFATHIDLLVRSKLRASDVLLYELDEQVKAGKVTVHLETATDEIVSTDGKTVSGVKITENGASSTLTVDGVFVFIGLLPNTGFLKDSAVELDEIGMIKTDIGLQTSMSGVFASGDVRSGATAQIASAVGEGATAALRMREYLEELKRK